MRQSAAPPGARPSLAAARLVRVGGFALEALGQMRVQTRGLAEAARRRAQAQALARVARDVCRVHGFQLDLEGRLPDGPAVWVANHVSYVDALVLSALAPSAPIAKAEVSGWPLVGAGARSLGAILVQRSDPWSGARALRQALRSLAAGVPVLGFPEGTTTSGEELLPFKRGLFGAARLAGAPIVPIAIAYAAPEIAWVGDQWFLPHYWRTASRPTTPVTVRIGAPLSPNADARTLAERARARVAQLLEDAT
jgi:1-acyl-sn-glycerol-3-phosphate acyltransferase